MSKNTMMAILADPTDPEDFDVDTAALERGLVGRKLRKLRTTLGLSQSEFATRYGIPLANIRQYEIGRTMPPPAVRSYLKVIEADPVRVATFLGRPAA